MESSLNSSSPEPTVSGVKSIFNKPANVSQVFEVSLDESVTAVPSNKSDLTLEATSTEVDKVLLFRKSSKCTPQDFDFNAEDSTLNSDSEKSVTFSKARQVFTRKNKSLIDFFNVSYNETSGSLLQDDSARSTDESIFNRNLFKKKNDSHHKLSIRNEPSMLKVVLEESQRADATLGSGEEDDPTTFVTKQNPFQRGDQHELSTPLEMSVAAEDKTTEGGDQDSRLSDNWDSDMVTKPNPFQRKQSLLRNNSVSVTDVRSTTENALLTEPNQASNISIDRSVSNITHHSASILEHSTINDENLNNWMSDQSDDEMPPPTVPSVTANLSHTKEKPPVSDPPTAETNQISIWEQKLKDIVSNAERKSKSVRTNIISPAKPKPFKKSDQNIAKPVGDVQKYKPKLVKPAPFATKKLYEYIIKRLEPKYGLDSVVESENLVLSICDTVKKVLRRKTHQKRLIQNLKKEMAEAGLIKTTVDFYEFVIKFLPYSFRVKVIPCVQPVTNVVFPPKDSLNPFDNIL